MTTKFVVRAGAGLPAALLAIALVLGNGCSGDGGGKPDSAAAGGSTGKDAGATGGTVSSGGAVTAGGATGAGGVTGAGGSVATGGARAIDAGQGGAPGVDGGTGGSAIIDASLEQAPAIDGSTPGLDAGQSEAGAIDLGPPTSEVGKEAGSDLGSDTGVADAPVSSGVCALTFASSTANLAAATTPVSNGCIAEQFTDGTNPQWNFGDNDSFAGTLRMFNIDWFDVSTPVGTTLKVEDGYNITTAWTGINVSYDELPASGDTYGWTGDRGSVTLTAIAGKTFTVTLTAVHFSPTADPFGQNKATGSFEMNGTITADMP